MRNKNFLLIIISIVSVITYLSIFLVSQWQVIQYSLSDPNRAPYVFQMIGQIVLRRTMHIVAFLIVGVIISFTTLIFQTLTQNKILTPSLLGFESIYAVTQTTIVFFMGSISPLLINLQLNFMVSVLLMMGVTLLMYQFVLKKNKNNIILLLLIGMVLSTLAQNYASFLQVLMHPEEFQTVASLTSVSITNIEIDLIFWVLPIVVISMIYLYRKHYTYDVMQLGEVYAKNLGINYSKETYTSLIFVSLLTAISTALVGPLSFLGLLSVNLAREFTKKYQHKHLFFTSSIISIIFLALGQSIIELTGFVTTVTTFISIVGGSYMIYLIVKEHKI